MSLLPEKKHINKVKIPGSLVSYRRRKNKGINGIKKNETRNNLLISRILLFDDSCISKEIKTCLTIWCC